MKIDIFDTDKKYNIIYADPPWTYPKTGGTKNSRGMAKQFYSTMTVEDIKSLPIPRITEENALLFFVVYISAVTKWIGCYQSVGF